jgi:hypothetical protein
MKRIVSPERNAAVLIILAPRLGRKAKGVHLVSLSNALSSPSTLSALILVEALAAFLPPLSPVSFMAIG